MKIVTEIKNFIIAEGEPGINLKSTSDSDNLIEMGIIDSLLILKLMAYLEEKHGIILNDDELDPENFASIQKISGLIEQKSKN